MRGFGAILSQLGSYVLNPAGRQNGGMPRNRIAARFLAIMDGLLPRHCVLCGLESGPHNLCPGCAADLPRIGHGCRLCALPLPVLDSSYCGACLVRPPPWHRAVAALEYQFPVDHLVSRFKYRRNLACGEVLGRELVRAVMRNCDQRPDCILPVPMHGSRHRSRLINQADLLARRLGRELRIPVHGRLLCRIRPTPAQSGLDAVSRRRNLRGAIRLHADGRKPPRLGRVALVDDVMTTGTTLSECARVLTAAGACRVVTWVAAVTPPGRQK